MSKSTQIDHDYKDIGTDKINVRDTFQIGGTSVTATATELNKLDGATVTVDEINILDGFPANADISLDTEGTTAANTIRATIQLEDGNGVAVAGRYLVRMYLSDVATGIAVATTAPNNNIAAGAEGTIHREITTDKDLEMYTNATGAADLDISDTGTPTFYLVAILPSGKAVISSAITFA